MKRAIMETGFRRARDIRIALGALLVLSMAANLALSVGLAGREAVTAEVLKVANGRVAFRLEDGRTLELGRGDPQLRHLDHAWASTVHAFQGRTVDNVIAAMKARHPHLTTQKSLYVEISRARDRAELVTDDAAELKAQLQAVTGQRIATLEGIGETRAARLGSAAPCSPDHKRRKLHARFRRGLYKTPIPRQTPPACQLVRMNIVSPRNGPHRGPSLQRLRYNPSLHFVRPATTTATRRKHFNRPVCLN